MYLAPEQDRVTQESGTERLGLRYGINSASLRFIHCDNMEAEGYRASLSQVEEIR
jgi:peptide-methionine (R)-S-oxide reductase